MQTNKYIFYKYSRKSLALLSGGIIFRCGSCRSKELLNLTKLLLSSVEEQESAIIVLCIW